MKHYALLLAFLTFYTTQYAHAWGGKDLGEELAVPVTTDSKYFLIGGTAITLTLVFFEDAIIDPFQKKQVRNKTLGQSSKWGDFMGQLVPNALYAGGMAIAGYYGDPEGYRRAIGMFKATAYATSVSTILKYTVREPRPIDPKWKTSFPSGHTTSAFAFSGYALAEHEYWLGVPAILLSTFIGYSRINDNMHWLHDVTAGATIGFVYGWGISKYQQKSKATSESAFIIPLIDSKTAGLAFYKEF